MSELTLTKFRLRNGVWEGRLTGATTEHPPEIGVTHQDEPVETVELTEADGEGWDLRITIPRQAIADGVQSFVIFDRTTGVKLGDFALIAGEAASDTLHAEVDLLRAELDMLKRAFRRHCIETM
ncbi:hypothetical protein M3P21_15025 [Ruegeria sp. 2012CJ41-6]|uniref:Uncharacterized protein n=1 Tax=Ruegeria spongiae TaxID=2942209 RepID=A0ABT0Q4R2_9RHOB|nr:hypothetical protein [Ruegeria spongiae]MCL6284844.1 hypothetical protein [Ruegeria spongiae]